MDIQVLCPHCLGKMKRLTDTVYIHRGGGWCVPASEFSCNCPASEGYVTVFDDSIQEVKLDRDWMKKLKRRHLLVELNL